MQLTFLLEEAPASHSASPDYVKAWLTLAATSCSPILPLLHDIAPNGWSGKMYPVSCRLTGDGILEPSSGRWASSGMGSATECLTLNMPEWVISHTLSHSDAAVCSLSDILETGDLPQRYFLTARACAGILRRAERRGKELPEALHQALVAVVK